MASLTGGTSDAVVDSFDFGRFNTVVDVGGDGTLSRRSWVGTRRSGGLLYDVAHVADRPTRRSARPAWPTGARSAAATSPRLG